MSEVNILWGSALNTTWGSVQSNMTSRERYASRSFWRTTPTRTGVPSDVWLPTSWLTTAN